MCSVFTTAQQQQQQQQTTVFTPSSTYYPPTVTTVGQQQPGQAQQQQFVVEEIPEEEEQEAPMQEFTQAPAHQYVTYQPVYAPPAQPVLGYLSPVSVTPPLGLGATGGIFGYPTSAYYVPPYSGYHTGTVKKPEQQQYVLTGKKPEQQFVPTEAPVDIAVVHKVPEPKKVPNVEIPVAPVQVKKIPVEVQKETVPVTKIAVPPPPPPKVLPTFTKKQPGFYSNAQFGFNAPIVPIPPIPPIAPIPFPGATPPATQPIIIVQPQVSLPPQEQQQEQQQQSNSNVVSVNVDGTSGSLPATGNSDTLRLE